jgi:hypothetical protein
VARLQRNVKELEAERNELREDLALARSWVRDLLAWIEREGTSGEQRVERPPTPPGPLRRAATIVALVSAPWVLVGGGVAAGLALS